MQTVSIKEREILTDSILQNVQVVLTLQGIKPTFYIPLAIAGTVLRSLKISRLLQMKAEHSTWVDCLDSRVK